MSIHETAVIHESAVIDPGAHIGAGVKIGPFCHVQSEARIGDGCTLDSGVTVCRYTDLGEECHVHGGVVLGGTPQDLAFDIDMVSHLRVGRNCTIREGVTIHRGTGESTETVVGDDCFLMANSHVGHNSRIGNGVILVNGALIAGHAELGDNVIISGHSVVHQHCRVGRLAMIGGLSGVSKDLPPFFLVHANGPNRVAAINAVGLRRAGFSQEDRKSVKQAFRMLYLEGRTVTDAVRSMREIDSDPVRELCTFIEQSKRGICGYIRDNTRDD